MAEPGSASDLRYLPSSPAPKKASPNVSSGWIVMLLSGLVAAVVFLYVTNQSTQRYRIAVASENISAGQILSPDSFVPADINADKAQLDKLILFSERQKFDGWVAAGPVDQGTPFAKSAVREAAASEGRRSMSIPVEKEHAVNGALRSGDRIDIVEAEGPSYVVRGIDVLTVNESNGSALAGGGAFSITVAVTSDQALKISKAIERDKFDIVRATGANDEPVTSTSNSSSNSSSSSGSTSSSTSTTTTTTSSSSRQ